MAAAIDLALIQARMDRSPFLKAMGVHLLSAGTDEVELEVGWQPWFVATPELGGAAGGILSIILDVAASYSVIVASGEVWATIDLRCDYHSRAEAGALRATGRVVRRGRRIATADASLFDRTGKLVASGRTSLMSTGIPISGDADGA